MIRRRHYTHGLGMSRGMPSLAQRGGGVTLREYTRAFTNNDFVLKVEDGFNSQFYDAFDAGFCLYTKIVWPSDVSGNPRIFSGRYNGSISVNITATNEIQVSNWSTFQTGTTQFSGGDIVSILVRHNAAGTTTIHTQIEGAGSPVLESSAARSYTTVQADTGPTSWGGSGTLILNSEMYDSALWLGDVVSEADGLELIAGTKDIGDITTTPDSWFEAFRGFDKAENYLWLRQGGTYAATAFFDGTDVPATLPTNFCVLKNAETGVPVTYDAGSGAVYWAAYANSDGAGSSSVRLATSSDLATWTDNSEVLANTAAQSVSDFIYTGAEAGSHDPFFLFYSVEDAGAGNEAKIYLTTSDDMSTWTADAANPIFTNAAGPGNGVEDFRIAKIADNYWMAVYEQDNYQPNGVRAVGAALNTGVVPSGSWTNQVDDLWGSDDTGFTDTTEFTANPCIVRNGNNLWVFYEGISSDAGEVTLARRKVLSGTSGVFDGSTWEKWGVVAYNPSSIYHFPNNATVESGEIQIYLQSGSPSAGGIRKQAFNPGNIGTVKAQAVAWDSASNPDLSALDGISFSEDLAASFVSNGNALSYSISSGTLPAGLSLSSAGLLAGTPSAETADATYTLKARDTFGRDTFGRFNLEVLATPTAPQSLGIYAPAVDGASPSTSFTFNGKRVLIAVSSLWASGVVPSITSIAVDGVDVTSGLVDSAVGITSASYAGLWVYEVASPGTGSLTVTANFSRAGVNSRIGVVEIPAGWGAVQSSDAALAGSGATSVGLSLNTVTDVYTVGFGFSQAAGTTSITETTGTLGAAQDSAQESGDGEILAMFWARVATGATPDALTFQMNGQSSATGIVAAAVTFGG